MSEERETYTVRPAGMTAWVESVPEQAAISAYREACDRVSTGLVHIVRDSDGEDMDMRKNRHGKTYLVPFEDDASCSGCLGATVHHTCGQEPRPQEEV